jgi:hypothetical protein
MFDIIMFPLKSLDPIWSLLFLSFLTGIIILIVFRHTSNQKGIKEAKNKIKAHLLEIRIFKDNLAIQLSAQKKLLLHNVTYMKHGLRPLLFLILPVGLIVIQMDGWYGQEPLKQGETTVFSVVLEDDVSDEIQSHISIEVDKGLTIETPLLRIPETRQVSWRIRANELGRQRVVIKTPSHAFDRDILVADGHLARISSLSINAGSWLSIINPGIEPFPKNAFINRIEVKYPPRSIEIFGWKTHWLVIFFVLTTIIAFSFKNLFKVEI